MNPFEESSKYFPTQLQMFQFFDKYSRFNWEYMRRETWIETVDRAVGFLRELSHNKLSDEEYNEIRDAMLNMEALPSMRLLAMAGEAARRQHMAIFNCVGEETQFITTDGVRSFEDYEDGDTVTVLTHTGEWKPAVVHSYGEQMLYKIRIARGRSSYIVRATKDHQWILKDGSRTHELSEKMQLYRPPRLVGEWRYEDSDPVARFYWCMGYVYGDGTLVRDRNGEYKYSMVRLCGEDKNRFLKRFQEMGFSTSSPPSVGTDAIAYTGHYLKTLPSIEEDGFENVMAFVRGYLDADGAKNGNGGPSPFVSIQATGEESIDFIRRVFPSVGAYITREVDRTGQKTNFGVRPKTTFFGLVLGFGQSSNSTFSVQEITEDKVETVWCLEVEDDHSFVMPNGIVTGNCSFVPVDSIESFVEALLVSMSGTGVGFSVERQFVDKLPVVKPQTGEEPTVHVVEDSAEGWGNALRIGLSLWYSGHDVVFDYSLVRPAGAILKTKGGRASGPEPLRKLLDFTRDVLLSRQGEKITTLDAHDIMCMIGGCVISGGTRRSAMLSLFDFDDTDMMYCKYPENIVGNEQRWNANNSAVWPERRLTYDEISDFLSVVFSSGTGEPGIFSRRAAKLTMPEYRDKNHVFGTNPSMTGDTLVLTANGIYPIKELEDTEFTVFGVDGEPALATCFLSERNAELYGVVLENGYTYRVTAEHKWPVVDDSGDLVYKTTLELDPGDQLVVTVTDDLPIRGEGPESFADGFVAGVLAAATRTSDLYGTSKIVLCESDYKQFGKLIATILERPFDYSEEEENYWYECAIGPDDTRTVNGLPELVWNGNEEYRKGFIDGVFSIAGFPHRDISTITHSKIVFMTPERVSVGLRELLGFYGVISSLDNSGYLVVEDKRSAARLADIVRMSHNEKQEHLDNSFSGYSASGETTVRVRSVELLHETEDVWDITVMDDKHSFRVSQCVTGNCGEVVLRPYQTCNLSIAVARADDTKESLERKVRVATIIGTIQSMADRYPGLNARWSENAHEERLLGVDITGQLDSKAAQDPEIQSYLREVAIKTNEEYAARLGINKSASVTCVKPSGNSSVLLDCSPGIHPRWSKYYIRNVRVNAHSPLYHVLKESGVPMDPENGQTAENATTWVAHFPVKSPEGAVVRSDRGAIEQLDYWLQVKTNWTTHNPSATIHYNRTEEGEIVRWVYEHQDMIGGITFLPNVDAKYDQMPYEEISEEEYYALVSEFPKIDFSLIQQFESEDMTTAAQELACMAGSCEIDFGAGTSDYVSVSLGQP